MDQALFDRALSWFEDHKEEFIRDLEKLVSIPSVADKDAAIKPFGAPCREVLEAALKMGKDYGFETENHAYMVGEVIRRGSGKKSVGIWGHLDVVPAGDDWEREPYRMTREGDVVFGRGVSDNKGPALMSIYLLRCLDDLGIRTRNTLRVFCGTDEEKGMADVMWYAANCTAPDFNLIPDSGFPVCFAEKGIIEGKLVADKPLSGLFLNMQGGLVSNMVPDRARVDLKEEARLFSALSSIEKPYSVEREPGKLIIKAQGLARHAAGPVEGINAVHLISSMLLSSGIARGEDADILDFVNRVNDDCFGTTLGIACEDEGDKLTCVGSVLRMEEGRPALTLNIRYPYRVRGEDLIEKITAAAEKNGYTFVLIRDSKPNYIPKDHPIVQALTRLYGEAKGEEAEPFCMAGGTYARKLPNAVAYGLSGFEQPDDLPPMGGAHQHDEGKYLPALFKAGALYIVALTALDSLLEE